MRSDFEEGLLMRAVGALMSPAVAVPVYNNERTFKLGQKCREEQRRALLGVSEYLAVEPLL